MCLSITARQNAFFGCLYVNNGVWSFSGKNGYPLTSLVKFVVKSVGKQYSLYCPENYVDHEKLMKFLVRIKEIRKEIRMRICLEHGI